MAKRNTKETILFESLKLFADKGYDGVTVRDIAARGGIKQSSLYKHYKSKQEIFDTLVDTMQSRFRDAATSFQLPNGELREMAREYATGGNEVLKKISSDIFCFYLKDPYASQFRKMLSIEKYKNEEIDRKYREVSSPEVMALQFFSPIFLLLNKYDGIAEKEKEAKEILGKHIEQFDMIYRKEAI